MLSYAIALFRMKSCSKSKGVNPNTHSVSAHPLANESVKPEIAIPIEMVI
jgi:hypothetical protein